jgi:hypothetical protein
MLHEHPDTDALADLAADVLPPAHARIVEEHVLGCSRCAALLADAERVRSLLLATDPGPIPPDVAARIERALADEARGHGWTGDLPAAAGVGPFPATQGVPDPGAFDTRSYDTAAYAAYGDTSPALPPVVGPDDASLREGDPYPAGRDRPTSPGSAGSVGPAPPGRPRLTRAAAREAEDRPERGPRVRRPTSRPPSSRRQQREETRRPFPIRGSWLLMAAGAVVVVALAGFAVRQLGAGPTAGTAAAGSAAESQLRASTGSGPVLTRFVTTGQDYTQETLATQVKALVAGPAAGGGAAAAPTTNAPADAAAGSGLEGGPGLSDPAALQSCLKAIDAAGVQPLVVDTTASYDKRPAAVLVLPGRDGGYEVWVVARDCREGADGTLHFEVVKP